MFEFVFNKTNLTFMHYVYNNKIIVIAFAVVTIHPE